MKFKKEHIIAIIVVIVAVAVSQIVVNGLRINKQEAKEISVIEARDISDAKEAEQQRVTKAVSKINIDLCITNADDAYWSYMELNGTGKRFDEKGVTALTRHWDTARENKENAIELCFKRYD